MTIVSGPESLISLHLLVLSLIIIIIGDTLFKFKNINTKKVFLFILFFLFIFILELTYIAYTNKYHSKQRLISRAELDIRTITTNLELFKAENYSYPTTDEGLEALLSNPNSDKYENWRQYLEKIPFDPWGGNYMYLYPGFNGELDIYTFGPDKVQSDDDFGNWQFDK